MSIQYIKFVASRFIGILVDTMILWGLSSYIFSSSYIGHYLVAPTISFEITVFAIFLLSHYRVWSKRKSIKNIKTFIAHFVIFNISCVSGFIVKMAFLLLFEKLFGWDAVCCNLTALLISGIVYFVHVEFIVHKKRPAIIVAVNKM
jgi:putative flippase GtrA